MAKKKESDLVKHAKYELEFAGFNDREDEDALKISKTVMELVSTLDKNAENPARISLIVGLFDRIASALPLTPLSDDPDEWIDVSEEMLKQSDINKGRTMHRNKRTISFFSFDGGKHWEDFRTKRKGTSLTKEEIFNGKTQEDKEKEVAEEYARTHPVAKKNDSKDAKGTTEKGAKAGVISKSKVEQTKEKSDTQGKQTPATEAISSEDGAKPKVQKSKSRSKKDI